MSNYILTSGVLKSFTCKSKATKDFLETLKEKRVNVFLRDSMISNQNVREMYIDGGSDTIDYSDTPYLGTVFSKVIKNYPKVGIFTYIDHNDDIFTIEVSFEFEKEIKKKLINADDDKKFVYAYLWSKYGFEMFDKLNNDGELTKEEKEYFLSLKD